MLVLDDYHLIDSREVQEAMAFLLDPPVGGTLDAGTRRRRRLHRRLHRGDRYIVDYLVQEVLQGQPSHVREFLLHTSLLSRLNGPLSDAVTGQGGGKG